ncbi:MAG: RNA 3'-terminal phosphate cyclase, partial [Bacteroidota bacterium]
HNPFAPPFEFLARTYLPLIGRMGPRVTARLERHGFYPAGGGRIVVEVEPAPLVPIELVERGAMRPPRVTALLANLPDRIARRELAAVARALDDGGAEYRTVRAEGSAGPGNVLLAEIETEAVTTVVAAFGVKGKRAEAVAHEVTEAVAAYLASDAPVGPHLADQLLVPFALAGGGVFRATAWTAHAATNAAVIEDRLGVPIRAVREPGGAFRVLVG